MIFRYLLALLLAFSISAYANSPTVGITNDVIDGTATGFLIDNHGDLLTAAHVAAKASTLDIYYNGSHYVGMVTGYNKYDDLALVHIAVSTPDFYRFENKEYANYSIIGYSGNPKYTKSGGVAGRIHGKYLELNGIICHGHSGTPVIDIMTNKVIGLVSCIYYFSQYKECSPYGEAINTRTILQFLRSQGVHYE